MADASASLPGLNFAGLEKTADSVLEMVDEAQHHVFDIQSRLKKLGLEVRPPGAPTACPHLVSG